MRGNGMGVRDFREVPHGSWDRKHVASGNHGRQMDREHHGSMFCGPKHLERAAKDKHGWNRFGKVVRFGIWVWSRDHEPGCHTGPVWLRGYTVVICKYHHVSRCKGIGKRKQMPCSDNRHGRIREPDIELVSGWPSPERDHPGQRVIRQHGFDRFSELDCGRDKLRPVADCGTADGLLVE